MRQHFRECSKGLNGSVMFGGASFFCANMLSGIIRQFQSEYPDIHIGWQELRNDELASQILQKKSTLPLRSTRSRRMASPR